MKNSSTLTGSLKGKDVVVVQPLCAPNGCGNKHTHNTKFAIML